SLNHSAELEAVSTAVPNVRLDMDAEQNVSSELLPISSENIGIQPVISNEQRVADDKSTGNAV
ncbi:MAG: hypothetical protein ACK53G_06795, partial [Armatimonadota bacterium]